MYHLLRGFRECFFVAVVRSEVKDDAEELAREEETTCRLAWRNGWRSFGVATVTRLVIRTT